MLTRTELYHFSTFSMKTLETYNRVDLFNMSTQMSFWFVLLRVYSLLQEDGCNQSLLGHSRDRTTASFILGTAQHPTV